MLDIFGFIFIVGLIVIIFAAGFGIGYILNAIDRYRYYRREHSRRRRRY